MGWFMKNLIERNLLMESWKFILYYFLPFYPYPNRAPSFCHPPPRILLRLDIWNSRLSKDEFFFEKSFPQSLKLEEK